MLTDLTAKQRALADVMSAISEKAYSAGWMKNLEYVVWDALVNGERRYGRTFIAQAETDYLLQLSHACNSWIYFDDKTEETAIDLMQWQERFKTAVEQYPEILKG